jgi:hypothetical protein
VATLSRRERAREELELNKEMLRRQVGKQVRLRPEPYTLVRTSLRRLTITGYEPVFDQRKFDHTWRVESVDEETIRLKDVRTDLVLEFGLDNVKKFQTGMKTDPESCGFLVLHCQVIHERGEGPGQDRLRIEPLP